MREVDPVPGLLDQVFRQAPVKLAFEDSAGVVGSQLGEGPHLDDVLHPGSHARFHRRHFAPFEQIAEAGLGRFDRSLVDLPALEKLDVLPADRRKFVLAERPAIKMPSENEHGRHRHGQQHGQDDQCNLHRSSSTQER